MRALHERIGPSWLLVVGFVLMFAAYEGGRVLHTRPAPYHLWRQTDCLSITANYQAGRKFLEPEIHARIADDGHGGSSAGEFPLIYWAMGQVWKITGQSEFAYRLFGILLHFMATWAFFLTLRRLLESNFWALTTALLLFTSPVIVYYSMGFLTDVPAFDLVLIAWYFVVRHAQEQRRRWWVCAMGFFALAALLKVSAGISLVAIVALLCLATLAPGSFGAYRRLLPGTRVAWITVALALLAITAWYWYAEGYNARHNGRYTFNSVWPIWEMTPDEVDRAWTWAKQILVFQVFDTTVWVALAVALLALLAHVRKLPWPVVLLNALLLVGVVVYTILWFHALDGHDYYFINPLIALLVLWSTFLWWLHHDHPRLFHARWLKVAFTLLLLFNVAYAANNMQMRYTVFGPVDTSKILPIYHKHELPFWSAMDYYGVRSTLDMGPTLDELGIPPDALMIYLDDSSINGSLYLMGRKGFTSYGYDWSDPSTYERVLDRGAEFLVFAEERWLEDPVLQPYLERPMARHAGAYIFDLRNIPGRREEVIVLEFGENLAPPTTLRMDTLHCTIVHASGWCFAGSEFPLEVDRLPAWSSGIQKAQVRIKGEFHMEGASTTDEVFLVLAEDDANGPVSNVARPLANGKFDLHWSLFLRSEAVRTKLYLWNLSGKPFSMEGLSLEVRRWTASSEEG